LRIEDHDRQRCRPEYDVALLEDLDWLGFVADVGPIRQTDPAAMSAYRDATRQLVDAGHVYGCDCTRATFSAWAAAHGRAWSGGGCPGACQSRGVDGPILRVALGDGQEGWHDRRLGEIDGPIASGGDLAIRDRHGNWTYSLCVVVDDLRQGVDLVVRGEDLVAATPDQIRLGALLGRSDPPAYLHHPLILRPDGSKLSKSAGDTGVGELRRAGRSASEVIGLATTATGWSTPGPG
jgi:glutamyl/glutaminyl-tRNA synthetase